MSKLFLAVVGTLSAAVVSAGLAATVAESHPAFIWHNHYKYWYADLL